ncbi:hippurate hydrolase [Maritalea myrionectae]|uniref:Hippurate hydrolase n=1 Tax=Maritalea myrionectae TaxID=454601 RepID=A0A2R4MH59_9HYPH|nr:M20 aminoacylase family protein [Maritalea myrionectae]AVX05362.1 hippurate hydrolase [Maritalea myrionectae]
MPIINRIAEFHDEITAWRRDFHEHPELLYDVHRTAGKVEELLKSFGCDEVVSGIGKTGVVGIIKGNKDSSGKVIGLRADMDALPIHEQTDKPYASKTPGKMHACGHDGHTAMLLGAAKYLAETRNFDGTVAVIFQPAEEGGAGGKAMVDDGMMDRFGIQEVFGMHNFPGIPVGEFAIREGGIMAAADMWNIKVVGVDSHAAMPHKSVDPIVVASHIILALQSIVARNVDPVQSAVVSTTIINGGSAHNIIPMNVELAGTVRALDPDVRLQVKQRLISIAETVAAGFGAKAEVDYRDGYPVTMNAADQTAFATEVAKKLVGDERVDGNTEPSLGGEDFSFMSNARPGAFIFVGNGDTAGLHQDQYDFNDEIIPYGCSYWAQLVETAMPNS